MPVIPSLGQVLIRKSRTWSNAPTSVSLLQENCKEPLQQPPFPTRHWEKLGLDLCNHNGNEYLYSQTISHSLLKYVIWRKTLAPHLLSKNFKRKYFLDSVILWKSYPMEVVSDGGPQFSCKAFEDFAKE